MRTQKWQPDIVVDQGDENGEDTQDNGGSPQTRFMDNPAWTKTITILTEWKQERLVVARLSRVIAYAPDITGNLRELYEPKPETLYLGKSNQDDIHWSKEAHQRIGWED